MRAGGRHRHPGRRTCSCCPTRSATVSRRTRGELSLQETPDEILVLPAGPDARDLENHDSIIGEEVVDVVEESRVSPDTHVLGHFQARDLVVVAGLVGYVSEVVAEDSALGVWDVVLPQSLGTKGCLFPRERDCLGSASSSFSG